MNRWIIAIAGMLGAVGVAIGAFGAHGLPKMLAEQGLSVEEVAKKLSQCDVAVRYHLIHVAALLPLGMSVSICRWKRSRLAAMFFILGIALFSGGLYSMVFAGVMGHWAIVPSGGLCYILGWLCVASIALGGEMNREE